ncbi:MAG: hypothetical protein KDD58_04120 [Bdellovibrionales bacterium]|nr:hypothetical protein [Bdellovibrionales bacterium]
MKVSIIIISLSIFSVSSWANVTLLDCAPKGGQQSPDMKQYNTYSLELLGEESPIVLLRKGFLGDVDQSYIEKETFKPAYVFRSFGENSFALGYEFMNDKILIFGGFWDKSTNDEKMASVRIRVIADNSVEALKNLFAAPDEIKEWQCLINVKEITQFSAANKAAEARLSKLLSDLASPNRVTSHGN